MMTTAVLILTMSSPILVILGLLALAAWRDRRLDAMVSRQIRLTDAIADEVGPVVAPLVRKPLGRPWRVEVQVPVGRPALVSRIVAVAHDTLTRTGAGRYELVLTPAQSPVRPVPSVPGSARRLQAA
ncbi:MAG TPA: hypothetical protein VHO73_12250 [Methylomirabilota bacterium]|jgi:hypothetical protein|nr:hypothetical protein [Methylomirabilota bacterium]